MEPLSLSSGAAGLISLGMTVCHGLLDYYRSWKDAEDRVIDMYASIDALTETFRLLETTIDSKPSPRDSKQRVEESIRSAERGTQSLRKKLDKIRLIPLQSGWKAIGMAQFRRTLFPFKESTLAKLKELGIELRQNLMIALDVLQIECAAASGRKLDLISHGLNRISVNVDMVQESSTLISENVQNIETTSHNTSTFVDNLVATRDTEYRRRVCDWLSPLTMEFQKKQLDTFHTPGRQDSAAQSLLGTAEFRRWLSTPGATLWCPGIQGTGKTNFASYVINNLQSVVDQKAIRLTYIYLSYKDAEKQSISNLLASLICQLALTEPALPAELAASYGAHGSGTTRPSPAEYTRLLSSAVSRCTTVFVVIDAFDEYPEEWRGRMMAELESLQPHVNLLVTSRDLPTIGRQFSKAIRLDIQARSDDIKQYLRERIATSEMLKAYTQKDPTLSDLISSTIAARAEKMFLQARLHLVSLTTKTTLRKLKNALTALPEGLNNTYDETMSRINTQHSDQATLAKKVVYWVFHAYRPLTMLELQHALAVETGDSALDEDNIPEEGLLLSVCNGLITYGKEGGSLALVHYTFQQYLEKEAETLFPESQVEIVQTCLTYLSFNEFEPGPCREGTDYILRLRQWPLLDYAVANWSYHARQGVEEACSKLILSLLSQDAKISASVQVLWVRKPIDPDYVLGFPSEVSALWLASFYGLEYTVSYFLTDQNQSVLRMTTYGDTVLHGAVSCGNIRVLELLLSSGADVNAKNHVGNTCLHLASSLANNIPSYDNFSLVMPLNSNRMQWNARTQDISFLVARLFLDHGADVNAVNHHGETVLHCAVTIRLTSLAQLLVARGADVTLRCMDLSSPLILALEICDEEMLRTLLENVLPKQIKCDILEEAMRVAAFRGQPFWLQKLLAKSSETPPLDSQGSNLLHLSAFGGSWECFEYLENYGFRLETSNLQKRTCLHFAAASRHTGSFKVLEYLLKRGFSPSQRDIDGWTPLLWAAKAGNTTNIQKLLDSDIDESYQDDRDWIPFAIAAYHGNAAACAILRPSNRSLPEIFRTHQSRISLRHPGRICDGCELDLIGSRYKCAVCPDVDYCFKCVLSAEITHQYHRFDFIYWDSSNQDVQKMERQQVMKELTAREDFIRSWRA